MKKLISAFNMLAGALRLRFLVSPSGGAIRLSRTSQGNWLHVWEGGLQVLRSPRSDVDQLCEENRDLFTKFYRPSLGDVVVDIGAGVGTEVAFFAQLVGPQGRLLSVEADANVMTLLRETAEESRGVFGARVDCLQVAVATEEGERDLFLAGDDGVANSFFGEGDAKSRVKTKSMWAIFKELRIMRVDFLKMNIEGGEKDLFQNFDPRLDVRNWCISCHDFLGKNFESKEVVVMALEENGYEVSFSSADAEKPWVGDYVYASRKRSSGTFDRAASTGQKS